MRADLENELLSAETSFLWQNKGAIASTLWNNAGELMHSTISAQPPNLTLSGELADSLFTGQVQIGGTYVPTLQIMGTILGGSVRTDAAVGAISSFTSSEVSFLPKLGLGIGIGGGNIYGEFRGLNSDLLDFVERRFGIDYGSEDSVKLGIKP